MNQVGVDRNESSLRGERNDEALRHRVETVRHMIENVRDRAEIAFRDRPYLVPVAAGALGLGIGVLLGSKLTRFILFTAVGTLLSEQLGGEIKRITSNLVENLQHKLEEGEAGIAEE